MARFGLYSKPATTKLLVAMVLVVFLAGNSGVVAQELQPSVLLYRSPVPMGVEGFLQNSSHRLFYLMGSAENDEFQGLKITRKSVGGSVLMPDGKALHEYPATLNLRITASTIDANLLAGSSPTHVSDSTDLNSLMLGLKYHLKVCQGLRQKVLKPTSVSLIGVPADIPSDERIYRVAFDTENIPVDARLVLEIFSPKGEKLVRFHLELL